MLHFYKVITLTTENIDLKVAFIQKYYGFVSGTAILMVL